MLRNTLRSAVRAMRRHAEYAAINVVGLALGIAVCLLITLFVRHELSYDDFHADADRIYRVTSDWGDLQMPATAWPMVREIQRQHPSLEMAPFFDTGAVLNRGLNRFIEHDVYVAQPSFFDVFTFPLERGTAALDRPYTAVLTPEKAQKYFGDANPVGKTINVSGLLGQDQTLEVTVTGVLEPIPSASHFHPRIIVSWQTIEAAFDFSKQRADAWGSNGIRAYLTLPEDASPEALAAQFTQEGKTRAGEEWNGATLHLQPMTDVHLYSNMDQELEPNGSAAYVGLFALVAAIVLLLACVNFVNLATARGMERAKEVGVRKSLGGSRGQLVRQFLAEAFVLTSAALVLAGVLAATAMPLLRSLTGADLHLTLLTDPFTTGALAVIGLVTTLGAGGYPAFVLSRFDPVRVLRGSARASSQGSATLRKGLVVFQFATAIVLVAGTIVAYGQLDYLQDASLGFDQKQVVTVPMPPGAASASASQSFLDRAAQQPGVTAASQSSESLPSELLSGGNFAFAGLGVDGSDYHGLRVVTVGYDFFKALGVEPIAGRTFQRGRPADSAGVVLNRAAYEQLAGDLPGGERSAVSAVERSLAARGGWPVENPEVLGVVEDFHLATLRERIEPVAFFLHPVMIDTYYLRVDATRAETALAGAETALAGVESVWREVFPDAPFAYTFTDQSFVSAYRAEQRMSTLFGVFAGLAIFIACLGLFGLVAYAAQQRTKEIGIRKAVGASVGQIVGLFSKEFARLVAVAVVVALPLAYAGLHRWLETFAYHGDLGPGVFLLAAGGTFALALLTVSAQALRAARLDPARVLRSE